jgi:hypothetical protein
LTLRGTGSFVGAVLHCPCGDRINQLAAVALHVLTSAIREPSPGPQVGSGKTGQRNRETNSPHGGRILLNQASGGAAGLGGSDGVGLGGGIFNAGTLAIDAITVVNQNHASTSNDNIFP